MNRSSLAIFAALLLASCLAGGCTSSPPATTTVHAPPPIVGAAKFVNIAPTAGINYTWTISGTRPLNILQTIGNGCAFLDYNASGNQSVLLVGTDHVVLYKGDGKGHFTDVSQAMGLAKLKGHFLGVAVGDYDNDGYPDLYLSAYRGGVLLHNTHGTGFQDVTAQAGIKPQPWGTSCAFADVTGSGKLDLYIGNYVQYGPKTDPQLCDSNGIKTACGPRYYLAEKGMLYHNLGGGKFQDITVAMNGKAISGKTLGAAFADFNGSGKPSLALANDEMAGDLLQNKGKKFENVGAASNTAYDNVGSVHGGMGLDWGDYNNDGKLDLAVATYFNENKCVYKNSGGGFFDDQSAALAISDSTRPYVSFGCKWLDYDNDGWLDLVYANGHVQDNISAVDKTATYREPMRLLHSVGGTRFDDVTAASGADLQTPLVGRGLATGDFDNDGKIDVLVVDSEGKPLLLHNETPTSNHWLGLSLVGTGKSSRDAYGATVTVKAGGRTVMRVCHSDGSYLSASDKRVLIGLGSATTIDSVTLRWPDGITQNWKPAGIDRYFTVKETVAP